MNMVVLVSQIFSAICFVIAIVFMVHNRRLLNKYIRMIKDRKTFKDDIYSLNQIEYERMKELGSTSVKLTSSGGIGVKVECWVDTDWVDITDYNQW